MEEKLTHFSATTMGLVLVTPIVAVRVANIFVKITAHAPGTVHGVSLAVDVLPMV